MAEMSDFLAQGAIHDVISLELTCENFSVSRNSASFSFQTFCHSKVFVTIASDSQLESRDINHLLLHLLLCPHFPYVSYIMYFCDYREKSICEIFDSFHC